MKKERSISVEFWNSVFYGLKHISIFWIIQKTVKNKSNDWWFKFVDVWVLSNLFLSIVSIFLIKGFNIEILNYSLITYGFIRVFEIVVYQINVLLFDEYRSKILGKEYKVRGYRRMIINLFNNFGEITFWFASSYAVYLASIHSSDMSIPQLIFNSFSVMTTFGINDLQIKTETGLYILWFQSIAGLLMTLISISRFIGLLPKVDSMDEFEN